VLHNVRKFKIFVFKTSFFKNHTWSKSYFGK
jgi:hypothetical protein